MGDFNPGGQSPPPPTAFTQGSDVDAIVKDLNDDSAIRLKDLEDFFKALPGALKDVVSDPKKDLATVAGLITSLKDILLAIEKEVLNLGDPFIKFLVDAVIALLKPIASEFGRISGTYVESIAKSLGRKKELTGTGVDLSGALGAGYAFDEIVKPIAFIASKNNPTIFGAGQQNIQSSLGAIVSIHLVTWVVNVISNLTGLGTLKFINSFNEVILAAMNARGMTRVAMRPYLNTFMVDPATNELNFQWPQKPLSEAAIIKALLRGALTQDQTRTALRTAGFQEHLQTQFLADAQKYLSNDDVGKLVNLGWWTPDQAVEYFKQQGWNDQIIPTLLSFSRNKEVFSILRDAGERLQAQFEVGKIDEPTFRELLHEMQFSDNEIEALLIKTTSATKPARKLTLTQVRDLFKASLVDLDFVERFLLSEGNSVEDAHLLILLDFTEASERNALRATLAARARLLAAERDKAAVTAAAKSESDIAHADRVFADKLRALASRLGG